MILFVFEGAVKERSIVETMLLLYPELCDEDPDMVLCSFGTDARTLYKRFMELEKDGGEADIVQVLKEEHSNNPNDDIHKIEKQSDVSRIYLFFDYDFHCRGLDLNEYHKMLNYLLGRFNNETEEGKLYISYPMTEALWDTRANDEQKKGHQAVTIDEAKVYKSAVGALGMHNKIIAQKGKKGQVSDKELDQLRTEWTAQSELHLCRAVDLSEGRFELPNDLGEIAQNRIFEKQQGFACSTEQYVYVLSPFPLFLTEYFGIERSCEILGLS